MMNEEAERGPLTTDLGGKAEILKAEKLKSGPEGSGEGRMQRGEPGVRPH